MKPIIVEKRGTSSWRKLPKGAYAGLLLIIISVSATSSVIAACTILGEETLSVNVGPPLELNKNAFSVYSDQGFLPCTDAWMWEVWTWDGSDWGAAGGNLEPGEFDGDYLMDSAPEGNRVFRTKSGPDSPECGNTNYAGWGIALAGTCAQSDHIVDLSEYDKLKFWVKASDDLKVEVRQDNRYGHKFTEYISEHGWDGENTWQEITIPASAFEKELDDVVTVDMGRLFAPFMVTVEHGDNTFYVDNVRWIKKAEVGNVEPTADFAYSPGTPTPDDTINFTGQWIDPDGEVESWSWDLGDGTTSTQRNPTHQYSTGVYTVTLTVTDDGGASDIISENIVVTYPPAASFTYSPTSPTTDNVIEFTDTSTDSDGAIVSWEWDFDDDSSSNEQNPNHQYSCFGEYWTQLTVTDDLGASRSKSQTIPVSAGPGVYGIYGDGGTGVDLSSPRLYDSDNSPNSSPWRVSVYDWSLDGCPPDPDMTWRYRFEGAEEESGGAYLEFDSAKDMSAYENLVFWARGESGGENFKIRVEDSSGNSSEVFAGDYENFGTDWQEVSIPLSDFSGVDFSSITVPWNVYFSSSFSRDAIVYIDYVRLMSSD